MIKSVCFDVDGVLADTFEANLLFFQRFMEKVGGAIPTREQYKKTMFHRPLRDCIKMLMPDLSEEEFERIFELSKDRTKIYPVELVKVPDDLESVLVELQKKYVLSIVTSRIRGGVFRLPQMKSLEKYFEVVVCYEDTVKHKPDPEPLLFAAKKLKIRPENMVYIGDAVTDMQAAKAAGVVGIGYGKTALSDAMFTISSFANLPAKISAL